MRIRIGQAACVALSMFLLPLVALRAQEKTAVPTYRAGLKSIAIPSPTGELVEIGPDYRVLFEPFAPNTNRVIAAFVLPAETEALRNGSTEDVSTYALVEVPRSAEFKEVTPVIFRVIAGSVATELGTNLDADVKKGADEVAERLKELRSNVTDLSVDKPFPLGTFFSESDAAGFGMIAPVTVKGSTTKMATGILLARVQDRVIFGYLFTTYKDDDTVRWLRTATQQWAEAILKANP